MAQATGDHIPAHEPVEAREEKPQPEPAVRQKPFLDEWQHRQGLSPTSIWIISGVIAAALGFGGLIYGGAFKSVTLDATGDGDIAHRFELPAGARWIGLAAIETPRATEESPKVPAKERNTASRGSATRFERAVTDPPPTAARTADETNPSPTPESAPKILGIKRGGVSVPIDSAGNRETPPRPAPSAAPQEKKVPEWIKKTWGE
jgi:hypothetical protein